MNTDAFTGRAEAYVRARPGYPDAAIDYIRALVPPDAVFADIGAGTGKFTSLIARHGNRIYAVEPNDDMREQLIIAMTPYPNALISDGTAENTKIPDHTIDAIICAQSLNKFDLDAFRIECRRIGKGNPLVIALHNFAPDDASSLSNYRRSTGAFYKDPTVRDFPNPMDFTRERWLMYFASMSGVPQSTDSGYQTHTSKLNAIFDQHSENGLLHHELVTRIYCERLI